MRLLDLWFLVATVVVGTALTVEIGHASTAAGIVSGLLIAAAVLWQVAKVRTGLDRHLSGLAAIARAERQPVTSLRGGLERAAALTEQIVLRVESDRDRRRSGEAESRRTAGILKTAFRSMQDGLVVVDADQSVLLVNPAARPLLSIADPVAGRPLEEVVRSPDAQTLVTAALAGEDRSDEFAIARVGRIVQARATPLPSVVGPNDSTFEAGNYSLAVPGGAVLVLHDVTDLRTTEKLRQEFVSNVSHELKTPLTTIRAYTDTLQDAAESGDLDPDQAGLFLSRVDEQAERLHEMIANLLALSRLDSPVGEIAIGPVEVAAIVADAIDAQSIVAEKRQLSLTAELPPELPPVAAERRGLRTILDNLIRNALQHTTAGGVGVSAAAVEAGLAIAVADTGCGIPRESQPRLFERFYRVDAARTRDRGGSGLGLAIVAGLVERFGGSIDVASEVDRGTTVTVTLPVWDQIGESAG